MTRDPAAAASPIEDSERSALRIKTRVSKSFPDQPEIDSTGVIKHRHIVTSSNEVYKVYRRKRNFLFPRRLHSALHPAAPAKIGLGGSSLSRGRKQSPLDLAQ